MMSSYACIRTLIVSLVVGLVGGCAGGADDADWEGKAQLVQALGVSGGDVPIPWDSANNQPAWDGTYGELAHADALAKCSLKHRLGGKWDSLTATSDTSIAWLGIKMLEVVNACEKAQARLVELYLIKGAEGIGFDWLEIVADTWRVARAEPSCNRDLLTQEPDSLKLIVDGDAVEGEESPYYVPDMTDLMMTMYGSQLDRARDYARDQVEYAYLNSCIAQNLSQHLESSQVAFVSARELTELQRFIMERAGSATFQYGLLIRALTELGDHKDWVNVYTPKNYLPIIRRWAMTRTPEQLTEIGQDMALSIGLLADAAEQRAELLLRRPESQDGFGKYDAEGWLTGGRTEILESLYGLFSDHARRAATVDLSAPEIGTLLGFARAADAVMLKGAAGKFDITTNAKDLLRRVEEKVRADVCEARGEPSDESCLPLDANMAMNQYRIRREFNIGIDHAEALIKGLLEFGFGGPLSGLDGSVWTYCDDSLPLHVCEDWDLPADLGQRLGGQHDYEGDFAKAAGGKLQLDPKFTVRGLPTSGHLSQSWAYLPLYRLEVKGPPDMQGFGFMAEWAMHEPGFESPLNVLYADWTSQTRPPRRTVGAVPLLAVAREALVRLENQTLIDTLEPALNVIDEAIGSDQIVIYPEYLVTTSVLWDECNSIFNGWAYFDLVDGDVTELPYLYCDVLKRKLNGPEGGPHTPGSIVYVSSKGGYSGLDNAVLASPLEEPQPEFLNLVRSWLRPESRTDRKYQVVRMDPTKSDLTDLRLVAEDDSTLPAYRGYLEAPDGTTDELSAWISDLPDCTKALRDAQTPCASEAQRAMVEEFAPVSYRGRAPYFAMGTPSTRGRVVTYGGRLNEIVERAWAKQEGDWSAPKYDGLGLLRDWAPVGDAVMHGGQAGEEAYLFFLRKASEAAREATTAIVNAFDQLESQAKDVLALEQSEEKASKLSEIEMQAVCGSNNSCSAETVLSSLSVQACLGDVPEFCDFLRDGLVGILGGIADPNVGFPLASDVAAGLDAKTPLFENYRGGQLQGLMVQQWSAWKALDGATRTTMQGLFASFRRWEVAHAETVASEDDYQLRLKEIDTAIANRDALRADINAKRDEYEAAVELQRNTADVACSRAAYDRAWKGGYTYSDAPACAKNGKGYSCTGGDKNDAWDNGPLHAWYSQCQDAERQAKSMESTVDQRTFAFDKSLHALDVQWSELLAKAKAARSRRQVAPAAERAALSALFSDFANQIMTVQGAIGNLLAANAAIDIAFQKMEGAKARIALDESLSGAAIKQRFGLDRRFRSYDLWRARALSENARRLAVSARRAIEARFVVNLSDMSAEEVFVEAPSVWADDIYDSDLTPPEAVGTTAGPEGNGLYANKLTDYVNQLELFVTGYAIERPTATVRSDSEVVQLAGPSKLVSEWFDDGTFATHLAPESLGWSFYCPTANTWVPHPATGEFGPTVSDIAEACGGRPPTKARLGFWLDPWGRLNSDHISNQPYTARHNTRWRRIAVNLAGTGIRDCSKVADSATCFSEPFLPYNLRHVGPSLVTNYEQEWRSLPVPTALIEGGKALAAEEWLDPVTNGFELPFVSNVARGEYAGRPLGGTYEFIIDLTPDVRLERIERVQLLLETEYWVKQFYSGDESDPNASVCGDGVVEGEELCDGNCLTECFDDGDVCTADSLVGDSLLCNVGCNEPITQCVHGDGCCVDGCNVGQDDDCPVICGDGIVSVGEDCDAAGQAAWCDADCTTPLCGDWLLNPASGEQCDHGGTPDEYCTAQCELGASAWTSLSASDDHTCGVRGGVAYCWGDNSQGQLGAGPLNGGLTAGFPIRVDMNAGWEDITVGRSATCALESDTRYCWGLGQYGTFGDGKSTSQHQTPVAIDTGWNEISLVDRHQCGIQDGALSCWGHRYEVGQGPLGSHVKTPGPVGSSTTWSSLGRGHGSHQCAINEGSLMCWGLNPYGQLGTGDTEAIDHPQPIGTESDWTAVVTGYRHTCGLRRGAVYCWGDNRHGQLGIGGTTEAITPVRVGRGFGATSLALGATHTCIVADGILYCWGTGNNGQLGLGTTRSAKTPRRVGFASNWQRVTASRYHTCGIRGGRLYCWGRDTDGVLGIPDSGQLSEPTLVKALCGDGITQAEEDCDDGNRDDSDDCPNDCRAVFF